MPSHSCERPPFALRFTQDPAEGGGVRFAVFDDTCGNLIQIFQRID